MSPDWAGKPTSVPYAEFGDPQSLNLYSFVRNSPIVRVDADGHNYAGFDGLNRDTSAGDPTADAAWYMEPSGSQEAVAISGSIDLGKTEVTHLSGGDPHNHIDPSYGPNDQPHPDPTPHEDLNFTRIESAKPTGREIESDKQIYFLTEKYLSVEAMANCMAAVPLAQVNRLEYFNLLIDGYFIGGDLATAIKHRSLDSYGPSPGIAKDLTEKVSHPAAIRAQNNREIDRLLGEANSLAIKYPCAIPQQ